MTARPPSASESTGGSSMGDALVGISKLAPLPEQWTLPQEWNMEKRETYNFWKMDVQNQIANISSTLEQSLSSFPHPDVGRHMDCQPPITHAEIEREKHQRALKAGNTLNFGLARTPHVPMF